jgi:sugar lactone lactonase YvrE
MKWNRLVIVLALSILLILGSTMVAAAKSSHRELTATLLVTGLEGGSGSTVGPDKALYVPETIAGRISRVDPQTGEVTTFASGLPKQLESLGLGGVMDVAFIGKTAYALVTLVASDWGGSDIVGIYRMDGPDSFTIVADIGAWSIDNPPDPSICQCFIDTPTGVQYALQAYRGGFLVTDGHHNRVLRVTLDGEISEVIAFNNIVPTGLAVRGNTIYMGEAGPVPHQPENSKVMSFTLKSPTVTQVASGAGLSNVGLLVDVEFGRGNTLYALLQGYWNGPYEGAPAEPNTGALVQVNPDGTFTILVDGLNQPTSLEFIGNTAYVIGLQGEIWKIEDVSPPPYGK